MSGMCPLCWLKTMARIALWVIEFWMMLRVACARAALAVRQWSPR